MPVPSMTTPEPNVEFKVYVEETTFPYLSAIEKCVVSTLSLSKPSPGFILEDGVD